MDETSTPSGQPPLAANAITDPERIRALAHPLRLEILELMSEEREVTATRCAVATGESVASCSFHLRMLAKYGYIERAEQRGRERPWRAVQMSFTTDLNPEIPGSSRSVAELADLTIVRELTRLRQWAARMSGEHPEWVRSSVLASGITYATREEAAQLAADLVEVADRFADRVLDPSLRPEGARRIRMFSAVNPEDQS